MRTIIVGLLAIATGCASPEGTSDAGTEPSDASFDGSLDSSLDAGPTGWSFETIETRSVPVGATPRPVELVRAHRPDGARTYLLYIHAARTDAPLVIWNQPYDGIDWTGEEVDARWAALGNGLHPDVDAPGYDGDDVISYASKTVEAAVGESAVHLLNDFAVVHVYGRFYAGGSLEDDILDATAAYHFALAREAELDLTRVASFGGSWGGMMALFGASRAPSGITLRSLVPLTPPSDFADLWEWARVRGPVVHPQPEIVEAFYSTYLRRITAATNPSAPDEGPHEWPAAWARYQQPAVCEGLRALDPGVNVLVGHDEWDVLIPVAQTVTLAGACPELVRGLYWPRDGAIPYDTAPFDHGPFAMEPGLPTMFTLGFMHIALALTRDDQPALSAAVPAALDSYLALLREEQLRGGDVGYATEPLRMLCHPRATYYDGVTMTVEPGVDLIAGALNRVYGTSTTPDDVCAVLEDGLPLPE